MVPPNSILITLAFQNVSMLWTRGSNLCPKCINIFGHLNVCLMQSVHNVFKFWTLSGTLNEKCS